MNHSARFAGTLVGELARDIKTQRRSHRFAGFAVLKAPDIPSVLVELGYCRKTRAVLRTPTIAIKSPAPSTVGSTAFGTGTRLAQSLPRPTR